MLLNSGNIYDAYSMCNVFLVSTKCDKRVTKVYPKVGNKCPLPTNYTRVGPGPRAFDPLWVTHIGQAW